MEEQAPTYDPDHDEAAAGEPAHNSPASGGPRTAGPDTKAVRETATVAFTRPTAQVVPDSGHPSWFIEDTEELEQIELEPIEPEAERDGPEPPPVGVQSRQAEPVAYYGPPRKRRHWSGGRSIAVAALVALTAAGALSIALRYNSGPVSNAATGAEARPASNFPTPAGSDPAPVPGPGSGQIASALLNDLSDRGFDAAGPAATAKET